MDQAGIYIADAVLGIDTLWGGDVMCPSGTGRFIADCWFSDEPLPAAYTHPAAERLRQSGGVTGKTIDREAVDEYLRAVDLPQAIAGVRSEAAKLGGLRQSYLLGLAICLETMWDLAMEVLGKGDPVPYARAVEASTGKPPEPSQPATKRERVAELLGRAGFHVLKRRRIARRSRCLAPHPHHSHGLGARPRRGRHRPLRQPEREKSAPVSSL